MQPPSTQKPEKRILAHHRTVREELLDQVLFWNSLDLEQKLAAFMIYYNRYRVHSGIAGIPPEHNQGHKHAVWFRTPIPA